MGRTQTSLIFVLAIVLVSCAPVSTITPTETASPTSTFAPTSTSTPKPTRTPIPTPAPIYEMLITPFAANCGDGISVIWANGSFNGPFKADGFGSGINGEGWGHMDIFVPDGCNVNLFSGEVVSPASGTIQKYGDGMGYHLFLPSGVYIEGIIEALTFSGIENPNLKKISEIRLDLAHADLVEGTVEKGEVIGDIVPCCGNHQKLAYQITINYGGTEYMLSPTLFPNMLPDGTILRPMLNGTSENWVCAKDSYAKNFANVSDNCVPQPHFYAP